MQPSTIPRFQGFGLGLRPTHYPDFLERQVPVDFVEVISENFMVAGGRPLHTLREISDRYRVALHGVSMSVGCADGLNDDYLFKLKALADQVQPLWVSDHLCWTGIEQFNSHDLLPLPHTEEAIAAVCRNVLHAQNVLERAIVLENPSTYLTFADNEMTEWEFMTEICHRTGCGLLLDVNNVFVSASNHGFDPMAFIAGVPADRIRQIHLAGHSRHDSGLLIDTHDEPVPDPVWALYETVCNTVGQYATMIERDDNIPPLAELLDELSVARTVASRTQCAA